MKRTTILTILIVTMTSFDMRELIIDETGFGDIRIGETTIFQIKRKHIFSKRTRTFRHALYRTDDGRIGKTYKYEQVRTKGGITYFFNYELGTKKQIKLDEILFAMPASVKTGKGVKLGQSSFKEVEERYGVETTNFSKSQAIKEYETIEFYSDKLLGKDSVDQNFIVTQIRIKGKW